MQLIQNGPDIPNDLLQAHEEGRVVFFCGAGISYPAGLPGFKGLVDKIYKKIGTNHSQIEHEAYSRGQFDATLDLLERRIPGGRVAVRTAIAKSLKPNLHLPGATETHEALLQLAQSRDGSTRLVTTNFDRVFEYLSSKAKTKTQGYPAPTLPIPKKSRWNGVVYLHGLLPTKIDPQSLNRLVVTSGDFGLAYLTERWASRFVGELFKYYTVCFVGYSINDPVLRYMMDAIAADRMLGENTPRAYALADHETGQERNKKVEWEAKGVTPILYEVPTGTSDHSALHETLKAWAETYRDGIQGKERIVVGHAMARPSASTLQDDFVGRMLWALTDASGLPAKRFAEFDPVPSLDWLTPLSEDRYRHDDLPRFGVPPHAEPNKKLTYSLVRRPAPYTHAPWMTLTASSSVSYWDDVMFQLARWLTRHLNDPTLVLWLAARGARLHERLAWMVEDELDKFAQLNREGRTDELDRIRTNAPNSVPGVRMQMLWHLLLADRVKSSENDLGLYDWKRRLKRHGLTATLRMELRELLSPKVALRKAFRWPAPADAVETETDTDGNSVECELVLSADYVKSSIGEFAASSTWAECLPGLVGDFEYLLRDALELLEELGEADSRHDPSFWHLPSITPHWQNRGFHDWITLIELLRDAWIQVHASDVDRARQIARNWLAQPYPTFRRLALFAATQDGVARHGEWVDWLLVDNGWWLWSVTTQRETMRLLVLRGPSLPTEARERLESNILGGPPREMFKEDIESDRWEEIRDHSTWLRLAKLKAQGQAARHRFKELSAEHPNWKLANNESDEFSHWMTGTGDPDFESHREIDKAPRNRHDLVAWLRKPSPDNASYEDNWRETCKERFFASVLALRDLSIEKSWPIGRWREALQAWSDETHLQRSWRWACPLLQAMPDAVLSDIAHSATWWLREVSKILDPRDKHFLPLCSRILALPQEASTDTGSPISQAINHPIGHTTEALLNFWFRKEPSDNAQLASDVAPLFTQLCNPSAPPEFRHGRVLLASRLISLFRVDREWTKAHLLPMLDWRGHPAEAGAMWQGFLWSPRIYHPLLREISQSFLETARHYAELGEHKRPYAALLTYIALDPADTFTDEELRSALNALPIEGLREAAHALVTALQGSGDQVGQYWKNRVEPFWLRIWPKSQELISTPISEDIARLAIAAREKFPAALALFVDRLRPLEHPSMVVHELLQSGHCTQYPTMSLTLIDAVIDRGQPWPPKELADCLAAIAEAAPDSTRDRRYVRLRDYLRRHRP